MVTYWTTFFSVNEIILLLNLFFVIKMRRDISVRQSWEAKIHLNEAYFIF